MVEFTIVLPMMLFLTLGVTELGRAMVRYNALTKSVRDGARYAAAYALLGAAETVYIDPKLLGEVRNLVVFGNPAGAGTPLLEGLATGQVNLVDAGNGNIRVDAVYPYQALIGPTLPSFGLGSSTSFSFNMQASVTMRAL
jgi:Flp pilus assembly protein TadG